MHPILHSTSTLHRNVPVLLPIPSPYPRSKHNLLHSTAHYRPSPASANALQFI
ncbi:hypothetical protein SAICODRAFT_31002 [Saitoella complicata NRRL Y-17804]|uniref:uncharacterized protein n=1 Tax=Saitoella complicata (strain BCRC 22490 / CBS 7301 / JCM 7358 / NBRC 10748 / NRRL Y-17804) TaxID=698492 RepID=UPI0008671C6D|nr:uncharacterized protein SAICODRAFT_31002 [Saitoella complicata NRRL Y-17804]ODQ51931.1 hypothetical protein SAICODRAFT_31002 [Saitoella complicata NRRL Y-17804]